MKLRSRQAHIPVLTDEIVTLLNPVNNGIYVDATLGLGGHTQAILQKAPNIKVMGFEWDQEAEALAREHLADYAGRLEIIPHSYARLSEECLVRGVGKLDGLIADLGVSSLHLDRGERGFSFQSDAPLDMRMSQKLTRNAGDLVAQLSEQDLADIFYYFGEERQARRIARHIVTRREQAALETTRELADLVDQAIPRKYHPEKIHVATKVFQALRIAVNDEFANITKLLNSAPKVLNKGARVCIISFHSLEDRIVKQSFKGNEAYRLITRKPVQASLEEIESNPRSRSAKLRVAEIV